MKFGNLDGTRTRIVRVKGGCPNQLDDKVIEWGKWRIEGGRPLAIMALPEGF